MNDLFPYLHILHECHFAYFLWILKKKRNIIPTNQFDVVAHWKTTKSNAELHLIRPPPHPTSVSALLISHLNTKAKTQITVCF